MTEKIVFNNTRYRLELITESHRGRAGGKTNYWKFQVGKRGGQWRSLRRQAKGNTWKGLGNHPLIVSNHLKSRWHKLRSRGIILQEYYLKRTCMNESKLTNLMTWTKLKGMKSSKITDSITTCPISKNQATKISQWECAMSSVATNYRASHRTSTICAWCRWKQPFPEETSEITNNHQSLIVY